MISLAFLCAILSNAPRIFSHPPKPGIPNDIPNPLTQPNLCGRHNVLRSRICDPENLIDNDRKDIIEGYINAIKNAEIAVVIISRMDSSFVGVSNIEDASEKFATQLHNSWKVGDATLQNGIVIFLSIRDRAVFFSTGSGVQSRLSKVVINLIIDHAKPSLRSQEYGEALERIILEIDLVLSGKRAQISQAYSRSDDDQFGGLLIFVLIFVGMLGYTFYDQRRTARMKAGQVMLEKLMKEVSDPSNSKFFTATCPICLEDFPSSAPKPMDVSLDVEKSLSDDRSKSQAQESDNKPINAGAATHINVDPKRPMSLQCGHVFCYVCLKEYLKSKAQQRNAVCPICREPVEGNGTARPPRPDPQQRPSGLGPTSQRPPSSSDSRRPSPTSSSSHDDSPSCGGTGTGTTPSHPPPPFRYDTGHRMGVPMHHLGAEMLFRMTRMRHLYPEVMTSHTHSQMETALRRGSTTDFQAAAQSRLVQVNRTLSDIAQRELARASGRRGASGGGGWGGGRSSGGGGGRW